MVQLTLFYILKVYPPIIQPGSMKTILVLIFVLTVEVLFNTDAKKVPNSYDAQYIFYLYIL